MAVLSEILASGNSSSVNEWSELKQTLAYLDLANITRLRDDILRRQNNNQPYDKKLIKLEQVVEQARQRVASRSVMPTIKYDNNLPISAKRDEIEKLISEHQVLILAGETGSGKTTQIPKICLQLGRGVRGLIGHTQPRRIAASTVASRIAEELNVELGTTVGYQVRFSDNTDESTRIKLMTDGILLAEIQQDPMLLKYDTLIIDEAHERSLNIDFLLGYLKGLLKKRPELKLIVTSATIDLEKFSQHFDKAPVLEVSGRTFPVEVHYRPWDNEFEDASDAIVDALQELLQIAPQQGGDILVFLSGEREIRETSHAIKKAGIANLDILPLYARLSLAEQTKVFKPHRGRRVVLATNVAETSLTVPGIRYVIDPGTARISRYSVRTKVQRLPIEAISQASANQRMGRCGRVSEGICIRLYSEEDFNSRPAFTDAEILRTNLAAVILQMLHLKIGDVRKFPFVDRPDNRMINDGFKLLEELRAVNKTGRVTDIGYQLQKLPVDPRFGRVVLDSVRHGCVKEMLIIISALSLQDPRERPADKRQASDEKHRRFWDERSDFIAYINLWNYCEEQRQELTQNQLRKLCSKEFINFMRLREWRDLHHQLRLAVKGLGFKENSQAADYDGIHRALLGGLLSNIGLKNEDGKSADDNDTRKKPSTVARGQQDYSGTRNRKFQIFPGSSQTKKKPKWLVAAEFLETSQLFSHCVAAIEPNWVLDSAEHLLKHHYYEPYYDSRSGQVMAYDRITLFGLVLQEKKRVGYSKVDHKQAREIFIRAALVEGGYSKHKTVQKLLLEPTNSVTASNPEANSQAAILESPSSHFWLYNRALIETLQDLENKSRRRDILVDEEVVFQFYCEVIPGEIVNLAGFEHWRKQAEQTDPAILKLQQQNLMLNDAEHVSEAQFPDQIELDGVTLPLSYHFEPGHSDDGVSVRVPVDYLHMIAEGRLEWLVPGLLRDKCIALLKGLPKHLRKQLVPVPQTVDRLLARISPSKLALTEALATELQRLYNIEVTADDWLQIELPDFYLMNIQVVDADEQVIDRHRNLSHLRERYREHVRQSLQDAHNSFDRDDITAWDFDALPEQVEMKRQGVKVKGYPALIDKQGSVSLTVLDNPQEAQLLSYAGTVRLALLNLGQTRKYLAKQLLKGKDLGLALLDLGKREQVIDDILLAAIADECFPDRQLRISSEQHFQQCIDAGRAEIVATAHRYEDLLQNVLALVVEIKKTMKTNKNALMLAFTFADIQQQMNDLFTPGFMFVTPWEYLQHYPRYLNAILLRLEKAPQNPQRDRAQISSLSDHRQRHSDKLQKDGFLAYQNSAAWQEYRWMIEELRVSVFAQTLKTLKPVSDKRLNKLWSSL